jgi:hypothetical protein
LKQGKPINVNVHDVGWPRGCRVCILYGETEQAMLQMLIDEGWVPDLRIGSVF